MNNDKQFMKWVDMLPEVGDPIRAQRDRLAALLAEAARLEQEAATIRRQVKIGRADLVDRISKNWPLGDMENAHRAVTPNFPEYFEDAEMSSQICALEGQASALDVLQAFAAANLLHPHSSMATMKASDHGRILRKILEWWNYAAVPVLVRSQPLETGPL